MGVVYKAEDTNLKRTVALKFLSPQALGTAEDKTRFIHEAQSAAALNHPNICTAHEIDEYESQPFIAMEWIEGESLKDKIKSGPLPLDDAIPELQRSVELSGRNPWMLSVLGSVFGMSGRTAEARAVLDELLERSKSEYVQSLHMAFAHLGVGEYDEAFSWLEKSYEDRDMYLIVLAFGDPNTDAVRDDPRYKALMERFRASMR